MLNYIVDPDVLRPLLPRGTILDLWNGHALISVVGFRFLDTRMLGVRIPYHRNFDEVNLRFYVRRELDNGEVRRAVTFVRELVPRATIALTARYTYNEPYLSVPMRSSVPTGITETPGRLVYEWKTEGQWQRVAATAVGEPSVPAVDSKEAFITEHYWGYTRQRDGGSVEYEVTHPPWRVWQTHSPELTAHVRTLYGAAFESTLANPPASAFIAEGSPVTVYAPRRI